jgi:hypothetical protein
VPRSPLEAATVAGLPQAATRRRKGAWVAAAFLVLFSGLGIGLWATGILGPATDAPVPVAVPVAAVVSAVPPAAVSSRPSTVSMRFSSDPDGAEVLQRGRTLGNTPLTVDVPYGVAAETFTFRKGGYRDATVEAIPDRDGALSTSLKKMALSSGVGKSPLPGVAPAPAAPSAPGQGAPAAPAPPPKKEDGMGKVKDLKVF